MSKKEIVAMFYVGGSMAPLEGKTRVFGSIEGAKGYVDRVISRAECPRPTGVVCSQERTILDIVGPTSNLPEELRKKAEKWLAGNQAGSNVSARLPRSRGRRR